MRSLAPRPVLLALTLVLVVGAIAFVELRLDANPGTADATEASDPPATKDQPGSDPKATEEPDAASQSSGEPGGGKTVTEEKEEAPEPPSSGNTGQEDREEGVGGEERDRALSEAERIAKKEDEYRRAEEIVDPSGFVNADGFSVREAAGEGVVLLEFWTYTCFNCQNVQPHMNAWHEEYADDGLQVVGVHTPEFGFEKEYANVESAVREAGIRYPVVLDNAYATWNAYDNRYWPAVYLIDADGFVRYKHFGEGAYGETEEKIEELLAERDRISS